MPTTEVDALELAIETLRVYCGVILLSFARHGQGVRDSIARNFVARGMRCTLSILAVWKAGSEQDAWILHRSLLDRLLHLHYLGETRSFEEFDAFSFQKLYEARHQLLSDPGMQSKVPAGLKELQKANKTRYDQLATNSPKWRRPKAEDVAKGMDLAFLYRYGYDYASMHVHPMATDGEADYVALISRSDSLSLPDTTVVSNSILIQSMLVQEALNVSSMRWRAIAYDFLEETRAFPVTGDRHFLVTMYKIATNWPSLELCEPLTPEKATSSESPEAGRSPREDRRSTQG